MSGKINVFIDTFKSGFQGGRELKDLTAGAASEEDLETRVLLVREKDKVERNLSASKVEPGLKRTAYAIGKLIGRG